MQNLFGFVGQPAFHQVLLIVIIFVSPLRAAPPEYMPARAELLRARDGLGNVLEKLRDGKPVTVAYFGGSITEAAGWRVKTTEWMRREFPKSKIEEVNAAIGGTGSDLGVFRLGRDALHHNPDLLFVEFAVNDGGARPEQIWKSMEGIVRQTWAASARTDICFVYTFRTGYEKELSTGECPRAASAMEMLAEHYGIPSINVALKVVELQQSGKLVYQSDQQTATGVIRFSQDGVHPLDEGHQIYTDVVSSAIGQMAGSVPIDHSSKLAKPFVSDHQQAAKMVPVTASMLTGAWKQLSPDSDIAKHFVHRTGTLWETQKPGSQLTFKVHGSMVRIYDLLGPDGGQVTITVDGKTHSKPVPRFDSYCTYHRIATLHVAEGLDPNEVHTITIELHPDQPDRSSIASRLKDPEAELKSPKFQGTSLRVSQILVLGDVVE